MKAATTAATAVTQKMNVTTTAAAALVAAFIFNAAALATAYIEKFGHLTSSRSFPNRTDLPNWTSSLL